MPCRKSARNMKRQIVALVSLRSSALASLQNVA
jgi:hypothetical protein